MTWLCLMVVLLGADPPASSPSLPAPSVIPAVDAPTFLNRVGEINTLFIHYAHRDGDNVERWEVIIQDRDLLSRIEKMHLSDWHGMVLFGSEHGTKTRIGDDKFTGSLGVMKFADHPFGFRIKVHNQPWALFVETGEAGADLAKLIDTEANKQRPRK